MPNRRAFDRNPYPNPQPPPPSNGGDTHPTDSSGNDGDASADDPHDGNTNGFAASHTSQSTLAGHYAPGASGLIAGDHSLVAGDPNNGDAFGAHHVDLFAADNDGPSTLLGDLHQTVGAEHAGLTALTGVDLGVDHHGHAADFDHGHHFDAGDGHSHIPDIHIG